MLIMRTLAVLGLCCIFGVQADFIFDFFSKYSSCANGLSVCSNFFPFCALFQPSRVAYIIVDGSTD